MCAEQSTDYEKLIKPIELINTLEGVLGELDGKLTPDIQPLRHFMEITRETGPSGYFASMPAHIPSLKCFGVKILTLYPSNEATSYPSHSSTVLLYENATGQLITQLDGDPITNHRTAAVSAIAVKHLTSKESSNLVLAVLGSSNQAKSHVRYLTAVKDFKEIRMWSRNADNVNKCISYLQQTHNINTPLIPYSTAEEACTGADVIVTVTLSKVPVVKGSWLKQGAVIICVGACRPDWRELDDELVHNSAIYADSIESAKAESGDIILSGSIDRIECDLCHIVKEGERNWRGENKFILFKSLGMALQDVASAHLIYSKYISK